MKWGTSRCYVYDIDNDDELIALCRSNEDAHNVIIAHNTAIAELKKQIPKTAEVIHGYL